MTDKPTVITVPIQWNAVAFPKSLANCARFNLVSLQEIVSSEERDVFRHLVDDDATGHLVFIADGADTSDLVLPKQPAKALKQGKKPQTPSQKTRFLLGLIWEELEGSDVDRESYYESRIAEINRELSNELEDLRRAKHYEGQF